MGRLIVLEGTDGSGKSTQMGLLTERLARERTQFRKLVFPRYSEPSSMLIRMYLGGEFGSHPDDVNAYAASTFYAVDRYASYKQDWGGYYESGGLLVSDRYTTSNAVHQAPKLEPSARREFLTWLYDLEYAKMGLPKPDLVIYLDMPTELSEQLMRQREEKTHTTADIHEQDADYLAHCRAASRDAAAFSGWRIVPCAKDGALRPVQDIHEEIYALVRACMEGN